MRAQAGSRKREASLAGVRSKLRWSRQLHSHRHRRQRDQKEQQGLPARFPACSTAVIRTGRSRGALPHLSRSFTTQISHSHWHAFTTCVSAAHFGQKIRTVEKTV